MAKPATSGGGSGGPPARLVVGVLLLLLGLAAVFLAISRSGDDDGVDDADRIEAPDDAAAATATITDPTPAKPDWPDDALYRPIAFGADLRNPQPIDEVGLNLWLDLDGWYLFSTGAERGRTMVFIEVDGTIPEDGYEIIGAATVARPEPHRLTVLFEPGEPVVSGIRFNSGFFSSTLRVDAAIEGVPDAPPLLIGTDAIPTPMPVTLAKGEPVTSG